MSKNRHILLSGVPGVGKTSAIKKLSAALKDNGFNLRGIYTNELRQEGVRVGFEVVNLIGGHRQTFASIASTAWRGPKVGKYAVDISSLETVALPALQLPNSDCDSSYVYFIDEIGKMELLSEKFESAVKSLFARENVTVVATLPSTRSFAAVEQFRSRSANEIVLTRNNRDSIVEEVLKMLTANAVRPQLF